MPLTIRDDLFQSEISLYRFIKSTSIEKYYNTIMENVKGLLKNAKENILLAEHTTFRIGGLARYFYIARSAEDIKNALKIAHDLKIDHYILGNGSNVLFSDEGFDGLVIKLQNDKYSIEKETNMITAEAGVNLGVLVRGSIDAGLTGLEWMIGIPGTFGGAIYGNAGAFGHSISENIKNVNSLDSESLKEVYWNAEDCQFGYRSSIFKENKHIILSATLKLEKGQKEDSERMMKDYLKKRIDRQPIGSFSAGSVFKNLLIRENQKMFERLIKKYPETEQFRSMGKIPAGWLIEEYGLKGKKIGGAMVSEKHGNVIINTSNAKATDVIMLISLIKQKIRVNFGIQLEEEIQYAGFSKLKT